MELARDNGKCVECQKYVEFVELSKYKINFKYRTRLIFFNDQHYFFFYVGYYGLIYLVWGAKVNFPPVFIKLENTHVFWIFLWGLEPNRKSFKLEGDFYLGGDGGKKIEFLFDPSRLNLWRFFRRWGGKFKTFSTFK